MPARTLDRVGAIYGKPFLKELETSPARAMGQLRNELAYRIRKTLQESNLSDRAKKAFAKSIQIRLGPSSVVIETNHPALTKIIEGQKPGQMKWLLKAKAPIPLFTDAGELIFRTASPRSMENGSWVHPGRAPATFVDLAREEAKKLVKKRFMEELKRTAQSATKRK